MATDASTRRRKIRRWRLGILLVIQAIALAAYVRSQFLPDSPIEEMSAQGKKFVADVRSLGGTAHLTQRSRQIFGFRRFLGALVTPELFSVSLSSASVDDESFGRFMAAHGHQLWWLDLRQTSISNNGLRHLARARHLEQLVLGNQPSFSPSRIAPPKSSITDAGLVHLKGIPRLRQLSLNDIAITDAGLIGLREIPTLEVLYLTRTDVKGPGLGVLKSMPRLSGLTLEGGSIDDQSLSHLAGATNLELLQLRFLTLTGAGLEHLKTLANLRDVSLHGCGLLEEEVDDFREALPGVNVVTPKRRNSRVGQPSLSAQPTGPVVGCASRATLTRPARARNSPTSNLADRAGRISRLVAVGIDDQIAPARRVLYHSLHCTGTALRAKFRLLSRATTRRARDKGEAPEEHALASPDQVWVREGDAGVETQPRGEARPDEQR